MKEERLRIIMEMLRKNKFCTIAELSQALGVSSSTIRRDLAELTGRDLVVCSKNGVIPISEMHSDPYISFRTSIHIEAKSLISREAAGLVSDNSIIFLDSSSTTLYMTDYLLSKSNLTVITNSVPVASRLSGSGIKLILIGGRFSDRSHAFAGSMAEEAVRRYNFNLSFMSSVAITKQGYAAETVYRAASMRRVVFSQSSKNVLLCDRSKMNLDRSFNIAHIDEFDVIVTDDPLNPQNTRANVIRV